MEKFDKKWPLITRLTAAHDHFVLEGDGDGMDACGEAIAEIERLRASQFRWIPVGERVPHKGDCGEKVHMVLTVLEGGSVGMTHYENIHRLTCTHWAPIPPLPEKSQADRDDEMLRAWIKSIGVEHTDRENSLRIGYLEGLKAARSQQP